MKTADALIIAAGRGSRFKDETASRPKPLIEFAGAPLIIHVIKNAKAAGITRFTVITGYMGGILEEFLGHAAESIMGGVEVRCIHNPQWERPNGISVLQAQGLMPEMFALMMSDHIFDPRILERLQSRPLESGCCRLAVDFNPAGVPDLDDATKVAALDGRVMDIGKKLANFNAVDTGIFLCTGGIFSALQASLAGEESLSAGIREMARRGKMEVTDIGCLFWRDIDDGAGLREIKNGGVFF